MTSERCHVTDTQCAFLWLTPQSSLFPYRQRFDITDITGEHITDIFLRGRRGTKTISGCCGSIPWPGGWRGRRRRPGWSGRAGGTTASAVSARVCVYRDKKGHILFFFFSLGEKESWRNFATYLTANLDILLTRNSRCFWHPLQQVGCVLVALDFLGWSLFLYKVVL